MKTVKLLAGMITGICLSLLICFQSAAADTSSSLIRFALVIGTNDGGRDRIRLKYATSDARSFAGIITRLGAVRPENLVLLLNPRVDELTGSFAGLKTRIDTAAESGRTELLVYYSGHSNEEGLLLGQDLFSYKNLREAISTANVDVRIAILDSCSSGSFTRAKGGVHKPAFLIDQSSEMQGYAFLTSSAEDEAAQESDRLAGSFFTHYLVAGLLGAADTTRDKLVTLNEAYSYAYRETLAVTENSRFGAQHPRYDIQLTGSGDLVLTDLRQTTASLVIDKHISGRLFIRDEYENLILELTVRPGEDLELGLEPGAYQVTLESGEQIKRLSFTVTREASRKISDSDFQISGTEPAFARGDTDEEEDIGNAFTRFTDLLFKTEVPAGETPSEKIVPVSISLFPNLIFQKEDFAVHNVSLNALGEISYKIRGVSLTGLGSLVTNSVCGLQASGLGNWTTGQVTGSQLAGLGNFTGCTFTGLQAAGLLNWTAADFTGSQLSGILNFTGKDAGYMQGAGLLNFTYGNYTGLQLSGATNFTAGRTIGLQAAGMLNISLKGITGAQAAGILNFCPGGIKGVQVSGLCSYTGGEISGLQTAGLVNISRKLTGAQIGVVNIADYVTGTQVGIINLAQDYIGGLPIGLINISRRGVNHIDFWAEQKGLLNLAFRFGTRYSYSIITGNLRPDTWPLQWAGGFGYGLHFPIEWMFLDADAVLYSCHTGMPEFENTLSSFMPVVRLTAGAELYKRLGIYGGLSLKFHIPGLYRDAVFDDQQAVIWEYDDYTIAPRLFAGLQF